MMDIDVGMHVVNTRTNREYEVVEVEIIKQPTVTITHDDKGMNTATFNSDGKYKVCAVPVGGGAKEVWWFDD